MNHYKLVRDKIPEILREQGIEAATHIADEDEFFERLRAKLKEEVEEFLDSSSIEELADIQEVLVALANAIGATETELEQVRADKAQARGRFSERIVLEETKPSF